MFSFFQKKHYLVDYLEGFVDIHNHILPGIDDGAKTVEDSIELIKAFGEFGVKNFICTPHIMHNYYDNTPETIKDAFTILKKKMAEEQITDVSVDYAAEHMIDDNFEEILEKGQVLPIGSQYLLIEMSYLQPSINFKEAIQQIASKKYFPILAHPERYIYLHNKTKKYSSYRNDGILFQLNLLSLSGFYGKDIHKTAYRLLEEDLINFVASDIHNRQQLNYLKELKISSKLLKILLPILKTTTYNFN